MIVLLNLEQETHSEVAAMNAPDLRRPQLDGYAQYHQSRPNLLLHIVFVPLFLAGNIVFAIALVQGRWLMALGAVILTVLALAMQGRGHRGERVAPRPFTGPLNAVARILFEQWVTFPRFVLCGAWTRALRNQPGKP